MVPDPEQCHGTKDFCIQRSGPSSGAGDLASAVFLAEGVIPDYQAFISTLESRGHCDTVEPDPEISARYHGIYQRYKGIYPLVREFYSEKY